MFVGENVLSKYCCENFDSYFNLNLHEKNTLNKVILLNLPKIKLEFERKYFYFQSAFLFNSLPQPIRHFEDYDDFKCIMMMINLNFILIKH